MTVDLAGDDAWAIAEAVRERRASAVEVAEAALAAARADELGAVWTVTEERALAEAAAVDRALAAGRPPGPLSGVPVGWKDLVDTAGIRTTYGSRLFAEHVPVRDADAVALLAAAGAVTVAKLSLHELAWGTTNENPHFGACRNPRDRSRVPGGSSGGSAAALAAGEVALAPGTDTGGSIRIPASCCGVVGLKPTYGRVSLAGVRPLCASLDHCGPLARSVRDCALALEVLAGPSRRDPRTSPVPVPRYTESLERGVRGLTVGLAEAWFFEHAQPDIASVARSAAAALAGEGARLVEIDLGWSGFAGRADALYVTELAATLEDVWPGRRNELGGDVARGAAAANDRGGVEVAAAQLARLDYAAEAAGRVAAAGVDVIAAPTLAFTPPPLGSASVAFAGRADADVGSAMCGLTEPFNVLGWPAISIPCGLDGAGLPVGLQLAAPAWREDVCIAAAAAVERLLA